MLLLQGTPEHAPELLQVGVGQQRGAEPHVAGVDEAAAVGQAEQELNGAGAVVGADERHFNPCQASNTMREERAQSSISFWIKL